MESSKKILLTTIGIAILVVLVTGVTFAFFNYTRTGVNNTIKVGRISFVTRQTSTINLVNVFPIDSDDIDTDTNNVDEVVIEIEGDTDYTDGIEYLVSSVDSNITTLPINLDITVDGLGTENANYFVSRESKNANIYKQIVGDTLVGDGMLLVGYIKPNTTNGQAEGINGSITIKAYFDKDKILISDTYDGTESDNMGTTNEMAQGKTIITTSEWNALQSSGLSFKVKVEANEGIWVNPSLEEIMRKSAVMDNISSTYVSASTGIDFGALSSDTNGKGVYMRAGTENDAYPIVYYRGEVADNNVILGNYCWQIVRTTNTGGVKLIYNGEFSYNKGPLEKEEYGEIVSNAGNYIFDESNNSWNVTMLETVSYNTPIEMSFKLPIGSYSFEIEGTTSSISNSWAELDVYVNNSYVSYGYGEDGGEISGNGSINISSNTDVVSLQLYGDYSTDSNPSNIGIKFLKEKESLGKECDNQGSLSKITVDNTNKFAFNISNNSPAYVGYMYGNVYTSNQGFATSGAYFGSGFTYSNGEYKLTNPSKTINDTHHYTCNLTSIDGTCATIRYYYDANDYVILTDGDSIEMVIEKMKANTTSSNAKIRIDSWYASNMTNLTNKLEDTIWCNDRSFGDGNNNGWIANGGSLTTTLNYGARERSNNANNTSTVKNMPTLICKNKNDAFTVRNGKGNGKLTYPVALLTVDEMVLAGGLIFSSGTFYLNNESNFYWLMSPSNFGSNASMFSVADGDINYGRVNNSNLGLRPAVSLKPGTPVVSGTGTAINPYVIE